MVVASGLNMKKPHGCMSGAGMQAMQLKIKRRVGGPGVLLSVSFDLYRH